MYLKIILKFQFDHYKMISNCLFFEFIIYILYHIFIIYKQYESLNHILY